MYGAARPMQDHRSSPCPGEAGPQAAAKSSDGSNHAACFGEHPVSAIVMIRLLRRYCVRMQLIHRPGRLERCAISGQNFSSPNVLDRDLITGRREFLPLRCFDDRDLKQAQRDRRYSYSEFVANGPASAQEPSPTARRNGQPLKVLLRHSDSKADTLLDLLVSNLHPVAAHLLLTRIRSMAFSIL